MTEFLGFQTLVEAELQQLGLTGALYSPVTICIPPQKAG